MTSRSHIRKITWFPIRQLAKGKRCEEVHIRSPRRVFPQGLERLSERPDGTPPTDGVLIDGDSRTLEKAGLRGADIIVGLDGYRVRSLEQYDAVHEFQARVSTVREMRLRVFRQTQYLDLAPQILGRGFFVLVRTYGTPGPSFERR